MMMMIPTERASGRLLAELLQLGLERSYLIGRLSRLLIITFAFATLSFATSGAGGDGGCFDEGECGRAMGVVVPSPHGSM